MNAIGFDNKSFIRQKIIKKTNDKEDKKIIGGFYSPLGVGVAVKNFDTFKKSYEEKTKELSKSFNISFCRNAYSSTTLKTELGLNRAIPFCDELAAHLQPYIDLIHVSYAILPPHKIPKVRVGGNMCPEREIETQHFLRSLQPYYAYVTAWDFFKKRSSRNYSIHLDGFKSKSSIAWDELTQHSTPTIYSRGDECNPLVAIADNLAFLTDVKLYKEKLPLTKQNVETIWAAYEFETTCHYNDQSQLAKIKWYNDDMIDIKSFMAKPTIFLMIDEIEKIGFKQEEVNKDQTTLGEIGSVKPKKFRKILQRLPPYVEAINKAYEMEGCVQFFDRFTDSDKIQDGDILAYMGETNKKIAQTYEDGYDVTVLQVKKLRHLKIKKK